MTLNLSQSCSNSCLIDLDTVTSVSSIWFSSDLSVNLIEMNSFCLFYFPLSDHTEGC